jgi:hypothetical protein
MTTIKITFFTQSSARLIWVFSTAILPIGCLLYVCSEINRTQKVQISDDPSEDISNPESFEIYARGFFELTAINQKISRERASLSLNQLSAAVTLFQGNYPSGILSLPHHATEIHRGPLSSDLFV